MNSVQKGDFCLPPDTIRDAICRVTDPRFPVDLSAQVRIALTFLLRRVEASNGSKEFWVRRMNFAEVAGRCDKTISNWLGDLERAGLIAKEQRRTAWGAFRSLTVRLTDMAIALLGLDDVDRAAANPKRKNSSHALLPGQSKETVSDFVAPSPAQTSDRLPVDLRGLVGPGMPESAVFKLMGEATKKGKRLSDIVSACSIAIGKARAPFAYIRALITKDRDYAAAAGFEAQRRVESDASVRRLECWAGIANSDVERASAFIRVGAVGEPCQVFEKRPDGKIGAYRGLLCGAELLRFVDGLA